MYYQDPTFNQRIRLLDICAHEVEAFADKLSADHHAQQQKRLRDVANLIADEASRMKLLKQRWARERSTKAASEETALTS